jgi:hypothetical protein
LLRFLETSFFLSGVIVVAPSALLLMGIDEKEDEVEDEFEDSFPVMTIGLTKSFRLSRIWKDLRSLEPFIIGVRRCNYGDDKNIFRNVFVLKYFSNKSTFSRIDNLSSTIWVNVVLKSLSLKISLNTLTGKQIQLLAPTDITLATRGSLLIRAISPKTNFNMTP